MRYIILSQDDTGNIGKLFQKLEKEKKIQILEKGDFKQEIEAKIQKLAKAFEVLKKSFIDEDIMLTYMSKKSGMGLITIKEVLYHQREFYRKIGIIK